MERAILTKRGQDREKTARLRKKGRIGKFLGTPPVTTRDSLYEDDTSTAWTCSETTIPIIRILNTTGQGTSKMEIG